MIKDDIKIVLNACDDISKSFKIMDAIKNSKEVKLRFDDFDVDVSQELKEALLQFYKNKKLLADKKLLR